MINHHVKLVAKIIAMAAMKISMIPRYQKLRGFELRTQLYTPITRALSSTHRGGKSVAKSLAVLCVEVGVCSSDASNDVHDVLLSL